MGIGISVLLIAVGLILALATTFSVSGLDLQTVGWILVAAGVIGLIMTAVVFAPRRRGPDPYVQERGVRDDRPPY